MTEEKQRTYFAKVSKHSEQNPVWRLYLPKEVGIWLDLGDSEVLGFKKEVLKGEHEVVVKRLR